MSTAIASDRKRSVSPSRKQGCAGSVRACEPSAADRVRARRLLSLRIEFVPCCRGATETDSPLPADLGEARHLSAEEEATLFRRMNQAKQRASSLLRVLDASRPLVQRMDDIERHLAQARALRDGLVVVFLKLAKGVVGTFSSSRSMRDELLAEAYWTLLRAIELFDPGRGFRFSSYAIPAIRSNLRRYLDKRRRERTREVASGQADFLVDARLWTVAYEAHMERASADLDSLLRQLRPRDEAILRSRFGLGAVPGVHTLQELAVEWGITRERVRQLERRALKRLGELAGERLDAWASC